MKKLSILFVFISQIAMAQGLFESAGDQNSSLSYQLNGYVRGAYFLGEHLQKNKEATTQSAYGETALKLRVKKVGFGEAFSDIRFKSGYFYNQKANKIDVREAYLKYYIGKFNFNIGKQIIVWGRADGYNPTDMLSLQDMANRSSNPDDKRFGNWMLNSGYNLGIVSLEGIWIPVYEPWKIPFDLIGAKMPIDFQSPDYPDFSIKNSSYAFKLNLQGAKIDGSVSYFGGYNPRPLINGYILSDMSVNVMLKAYKTNMFGADFQTTVGKFGLRGEFAYSHPDDKKNSILYTPNPDFQWVIGAGRSWGNFMCNVQYMGKWVEDFTVLNAPNDLTKKFEFLMQKQNRMLSGQQYETTHSFSLRLSQKLFSETLGLSLFSMYNITTEECMLRTKASYFITDAMNLSLGAELFSGPDETLFGQVEKVLSCAFVEMKIMF